MRAIIVDDELEGLFEFTADLIKTILEEKGFVVSTVSSYEEVIRLLSSSPSFPKQVQFMIIDWDLGGGKEIREGVKTGVEVGGYVTAKYPWIASSMLTGDRTVEVCVAAMHNGFIDIQEKLSVESDVTVNEWIETILGLPSYQGKVEARKMELDPSYRLKKETEQRNSHLRNAMYAEELDASNSKPYEKIKQTLYTHEKILCYVREQRLANPEVKIQTTRNNIMALLHLQRRAEGDVDFDLEMLKLLSRTHNWGPNNPNCPDIVGKNGAVSRLNHVKEWFKLFDTPKQASKSEGVISSPLSLAKERTHTKPGLYILKLLREEAKSFPMLIEVANDHLKEGFEYPDDFSFVRDHVWLLNKYEEWI